MPQLVCRLPGVVRPVGEWLAQLLPEFGRSARRGWIESGDVSVDGVRAERAGLLCAAGARLVVTSVPSGTWCDAAAESLTAERFVGWIDAPAWFGGILPLSGGGRLAFEIEAIEGGLARIRVAGAECTAARVAARLAESGMPLAGDLQHGGLAVPGGLRLAREGEALADPLEPGIAAWPEEEGTDAPLVLEVSAEAARAVRRGHPWLLPDEASDRADRFQPGSLLRVAERGGSVLGWAWSEGAGDVSARMAHLGEGPRRAVASVESRIAQALGRRAELTAQSAETGGTDCYRLVHGEADGLPGFFVDRIGPLLRVLISSRVCDGFRARALTALAQQMPVTPRGEALSVLELQHVRGPGGRADVDRVRWCAGGPAVLREVLGDDLFEDGFWVHERGLRFAVDPGWDSPRKVRPGFGLFPDQRLNRAALVPAAKRGGRWLNLFAHTGAFSVSLLAAGADRVDSVDLSAPYLQRLERNLEANRAAGVDPARHVSHPGESRRWLEALGSAERFDGIVLDPPTAAAAGRRFWSVKQDLEPLVRLCVDRLSPNGVLLVTQNRKGPPLGLEHLLERVASRAHRPVERVDAAPPGPDFPGLRGFPEGVAFEGARLTLG